MTKNKEEEVNEKLDKIIRLLSFMLIKNESGDDQIKPLLASNLTVTEISQIINKDHNTVNQAIFRIRKASKSKDVKKSKKVMHDTK